MEAAIWSWVAQVVPERAGTQSKTFMTTPSTTVAGVVFVIAST
jgi:hypothetical protein